MLRSLVISDVGESPMTLAEAKQHLRVYHDDDDADIQQLVTEAYGQAEARTGRMIRSANGLLTMDRFPKNAVPIVLPRPPLASVVEVRYYDGDNQLQTLEDYQVALNNLPGLIVLPIGTLDWPRTRERLDAVQIEFTCGGREIEQIRSAVRLLLDLSYNDMDPTKAMQVEKRIDGLLHGYTLRDPRLYGVTE